MTRQPLTEGAVALASSDRVLAGLVERHGLPRLDVKTSGAQRFADLVASIVYQQLAGKAAGAIHARFVAAVGGVVSPRAVLGTPVEVLRQSGLSAAKAAAIVDLATKVDDGDVVLGRIGRMTDEDIIGHLVQVRGIGRWTAEMFLLFTLGRPDVWPVDDYGVRLGYAAAWGHETVPAPRELASLGERFRPYRSAAAWYCWRAVEESRAGTYAARRG